MVFIPLFLFLFSLFLRAGYLDASFWNDEAHVALVAKTLIDGPNSLPWWGYLPTGVYQLAMYYPLAFMQKFFGESEILHRIPFVVIGSLIPVVLYLFAKRFFGLKTALLSSLLVATSILEIAWSRQVRPYIVLQLFILVYFFVYTQWFATNKNPVRTVFLLFLTSIVATLFHTSAIVLLPFSIIPLVKKRYMYILIAGALVCVGILLLFGIPSMMVNIFSNTSLILIREHIAHYRFFYNNYLPILVLAGVGCVIGIIKPQKKWHRKFLLLFLSIAVVLHVINVLRPGSLYVRYSLSVMPIIFLIASWTIFEVIKNKYVRTIVLIFFAIWVIVSGRFTANPYRYYSINADVRENPLADYKKFFAKLNPILKKNPDAVIADAWFDRTIWYGANRKLDYFMVENQPKDNQYNKETNIRFIPNVKELIAMPKKHDRGIVIIEEWGSLAGEEMKEWVKKNLHYEFTACDEQLAREGWCVSAYSWNLKK